MTTVFVYKLTPEELKAAQEHAKRSLAPRVCTKCSRQYSSNAQMVLTLSGLWCWSCHLLNGGHP